VVGWVRGWGGCVCLFVCLFFKGYVSGGTDMGVVGVLVNEGGIRPQTSSIAPNSPNQTHTHTETVHLAKLLEVLLGEEVARLVFQAQLVAGGVEAVQERVRVHTPGGWGLGVGVGGWGWGGWGWF
jgi:hypothetical protein